MSSSFLAGVGLPLPHRAAAPQGARCGGAGASAWPQQQRILARPLEAAATRQGSSAHEGLLQEPCLHAPEGRRGSHLEHGFEIIKRELGSLFFICALAQDLTELRHPQAENSVLFNALPGSLAISVDDFVKAAHPPAEMSVLALQLHTALSFAEELPIELRNEMPLVRALSLEHRVAARPRGAACVACRREVGHQSSRDARPPTHFSRSHACTRRKAAEKVISLSMGSKSLKREGEKTRARDLSFFRFRQSTPSSGSAAAAVPERAPEAGAPRGTPSWRSVSAQHPQLLQVAPVPQRPRVVSVEAVDLVVEGGERLYGLHGYLVRAAAQLRKGALRSLPSSSTARYSSCRTLVTAFFGT